MIRYAIKFFVKHIVYYVATLQPPMPNALKIPLTRRDIATVSPRSTVFRLCSASSDAAVVKKEKKGKRIASSSRCAIEKLPTPRL